MTLVGIIMGSQSDWATMRAAADTLEALAIAHEVRIVSAHRTPQRMVAYAGSAVDRGLRAIIAGAGGAAHLPGMVAALTRLPVFGVPIESKALSGMDSLLSIVQMPAGVPVGTPGHRPRRSGQRRADRRGAAGDDRPRPRRPARRLAQGADGGGGGRARMTKTAAAAVIPPGATIGILGGGQLGRMLALAAATLGYRVHVFAPEAEQPAADVAAVATRAEYGDTAALDAFAAAVDVVTYEFENVPVAAVAHLAARVPVRPGVAALDVAQDRLAEKTFVAGLGGATAPFRAADDLAGLRTALAAIGAPAILKTRRMGYDGKGQARIATADDAAAAWAATGGAPAIVEGLVAFDHEFSVVLARGGDGRAVVYDVPDNVHIGGVLATSHVPAPAAVAAQAPAAIALALRAADALDHVGVLTLEFFATPSGPVFNEMAPRVHNSGHWTIEGARVSQFENHIRAVCGLPLGSTARTAAAVTMTNLLGAAAGDWATLLAEPGTRLHLYGKREATPGRKMGHVTRF